LLKVRRLVGIGLVAASVATGAAALSATTGARGQDEATARAEASLAAARRQVELRGIEAKTQAAAGLYALNAALAAHVDQATIIDLLDSENWWRPYRDEFPLVRVMVRDVVVASRGTVAAGSAEAEIVKAARLHKVASGAVTIGAETYLLGAARLAARSDEDAVIVLGRRPSPPPPGAAARPDSAPARPLPWAIAGACALAGLGLLVSGGRKPALAPRAAAAPPAPATDALAATADAAVIPILPESTLKFGEARSPHNDIGAMFAAAAAPTPEKPITFGRYRLIGRLSEGGMSELFVARTSGVEGFSRAFVLKRLRPELARDESAVAQFIDEARLQARLVHSNIVPVFDFGVVDGEYFMTQEYILGRDLGRLVDRHRGPGSAGLPTPVAYYAAHETLQALAYAHGRSEHDGTPLGIVHRDVAAGNVIVSLAGEVKLSDFGIVKANDRLSETQEGTVKGNANFMSPEQARGGNVDARSDLFSLGLVLYYCLSGELLYTGNDDIEVLQHAAGGPQREDLARIRRLPDPAPQILERALAFDPNHRFQTAADFAAELAIHMGGGRNVATTLMRDLFGQDKDLVHQSAMPAAAVVGYTAGP